MYQAPLRRSTSDKMLGGVCGGIARRYNFDPAILRVAVVVAVFAGGLGLLAYAAAWLLIPNDFDRTTSTLTRSLPRLIFGVLLGVGAVSAVFGWLSSLGGLSGVVVGGFLVGLGVWLYVRRDDLRKAVAASSASAPPPGETAAGYVYGGIGGTPHADAAGSAPADPVLAYGTTSWDQTAVAPGPAYYSQPVSPPVQHSYLGPATLLAALIAAGFMGVGAALGAYRLNPIVFFAVLLAVVSIGLLISAFAGRARWLIIPALLLAMTTAATGSVMRIADTVTGIEGGIEGGIGSPVWQPTESGAAYQLGVGSATLDLTEWAANPNLAPPTSATTVTAAVDAGELVVLVPRNWTVNLDAAVEVGDISLNYRTLEQPGSDQVFNGVIEPVGAKTGEINLNLRTQLGTIAVEQVAVASAPSAAVPPVGSAVTPSAVPIPTPAESTPVTVIPQSLQSAAAAAAAAASTSRTEVQS